ncbi:hypothetical protein BH23PLA1_BH23PLA1_28520 [soil metagenome]
MTATPSTSTARPPGRPARLLAGFAAAWRRGADALGRGEARFWGTDLAEPR